MWRMGVPSTGAGIGLLLGLMVFFPLNAVWSARGWDLVIEAALSFIAGQFVGMGITNLYHRLFDAKDV